MVANLNISGAKTQTLVSCVIWDRTHIIVVHQPQHGTHASVYVWNLNCLQFSKRHSFAYWQGGMLAMGPSDTARVGVNSNSQAARCHIRLECFVDRLGEG